MMLRQKYRLWITTVSFILVGGCTSTTVVLVPDNEGKVGQVLVDDGQHAVTLNQANEGAVVGIRPLSTKQLTEQQIEKKFAQTLQKEPQGPQNFIFYFDSGSAEILPADERNIMLAVQAIAARAGCDTSVIGHADRQADAVVNKQLSLERAHRVETRLIEAGVESACLDVRYYGEYDPLVPTADGVSEPRNRRVVIEVR